jgi:lipopolysaccharide export system protein LptA
MYNDTNILVFTDEVKLKRPAETITSELIELDLNKDQLVAQDNVVLDTKKNDKELHLTSEYLKLWLKTDDMLARRNVEMDYDGQQIRGENLKYNAEEEEMVINKEAEIKEDEQWIKSDKIIVDLETGSIDATGQVEMEFEFGE